MHVERGDSCRQSGRVEAEVHEVAARRLIPIELLAEVACWAPDLATVAEECWVDEETARVRLATLTEGEREQLEARHARRSA